MVDYYVKRSYAQAASLTQSAQEALEQLENLLAANLDDDTVLEWEKQKSSGKFAEPVPEIPKPQKPVLTPISKEPSPTDATYRARGFLDRIRAFPKRYSTKAALKALFERDYDVWRQTRANLLQKNSDAEEQYKQELEEWNVSIREARNSWEERERAFYEAQRRNNEHIDKLRPAYSSKEPDAIAEYCALVLIRPSYADSFPKQCECQYVPENRIVVVDYQLPDSESFPTLKEVRFVRARNEFKSYNLSETARNRLFDDTLYKISLRSIHRLYRADALNCLDAIVFNGWVRAIDKGTGRYVTSCILSIQTSKKEFLAIDLAHVDAKECFRRFKGVGSSSLHGVSAVQPIMSINRNDRRFVSSYNVVGTLDESTNIAAMPWEDFEQLIRELFEKEFAQGGGEVRVTQASRDGGVDAVAFDPDPIRGGKIVIQAKRYTNVVGVSAVRDLYGTVINEGATKGILITTAEYGKDSYEFAKGKPITLLNGGHLLHLLQRHGYRARVDLEDAKRVLDDGRK